MKAKLKNLLTGEIISVYSTTDSVDSSYGLECWVDKKGNSYGQCQFGAPLGFELVECDTPIDQFVNPGFIKDYFSKLGKKGGSSRTPKKSASSAANLDKARADGKTGGYPLGRKRGFFMNPATGSVDDYDGWWYETEDGEKVNAVDRGEVVRVVKDKDGNWIEK